MLQNLIARIKSVIYRYLENIKTFLGIGIENVEVHENIQNEAVVMSLDEQLIATVKKKNVKEVESLLDRGADVNFSYGQKFTALHIAAIFGNLKIVELLIEADADINRCSEIMNYEGTPLHVAAQYGSTEIVKFLIEKNGTNVNIKDSCDNIALHCITDNVEMTKLLLKHGSNPNAENNANNTPIRRLLIRNSLTQEVLSTLLVYGATLNDYDRKKINQNSNLQNCLTAFEEAKAMPHISRIIEANASKGKQKIAKVMSKYINNETDQNKTDQKELIKEFKKVVKVVEDYGSHEQLSFIPESLFSMIKNMVQDYKKEEIAPKILTAFLTEKNVQGGEYIGPNLGKYLDHKDIENLALVSNSTYQNLKPLNTLLTQLKKVAHAVPKSSLAEVNVEQETPALRLAQ